MSTACMQSRKGIKGAQDEWVWGAVDMCSYENDCDESMTHLNGQLHYDSNMMVFNIVKLESDYSYTTLATDESISYRILAKRDGEGSWRKMNWISSYEDRKLGVSENMDLAPGDVVRLKPPVGYIEQYNRWILERVVTKGSTSTGYGLGDRLLDIRVTYQELAEIQEQ